MPCTLQLYVRTNSWPFWTAWGLAIALLLVLACVEKARRVWPGNMILLGAFTVVQAFLVGMITAYYNIEAVMLAFGVTAGELEPCNSITAPETLTIVIYNVV